MWAGVVLVAVSVVVGARAFAAVDDTTAVWVFARDLPAGSTLAATDLTTARVQLPAEQASTYLAADETSPVGKVVTSDAARGALIGNSQLADDADEPPELPLAVAAADLPADLAAGDTVQVWATGKQEPVRPAALVFDGVRVLQVSAGDALAASADRQVLIALDPDVDLPHALGMLATSRLVIVRVGGA